MFARSLLALALVLVAGPAQADCHFDGKQYADGAVVSGHVCSDNEWKKL